MTKTRRARRRPSTGDLFRIFIEIKDIVEVHGASLIKFTKEQYHNIYLNFYGKTIAIIGPKAAGKTTFINILLDPNFEVDTMEYSPTQGIVPMKSYNINFKIPLKSGKNSKAIKFRFKKPKDVGGEEDYRDEGEWEKVCTDVDYIFYIFDSLELSSKDKMKSRVLDDIKWIIENNQIFNQNFGLIIFANKIDKVGIKEEQDKWKIEIFKEFINEVDNTLDLFKDHLKIITPISLQSRTHRVNSIGSALSKVRQKDV